MLHIFKRTSEQGRTSMLDLPVLSSFRTFPNERFVIQVTDINVISTFFCYTDELMGGRIFKYVGPVVLLGTRV